MLRFSIKDLFASITLVAIGLGVIMVVVNRWPHVVPWSDGILYISGNAVIGAGILWLAKRPWIGAFIGASIGLIGVAALISRAWRAFEMM